MNRFNSTKILLDLVPVINIVVPQQLKDIFINDIQKISFYPRYGYVPIRFPSFINNCQQPVNRDSQSTFYVNSENGIVIHSQ